MDTRSQLSALVLALVALPVAAPAPAAPQVTIRYPGDPKFTPDIFFAVLEGLYRDGVSDRVVDAIIATDPESGYPANFVYACPICMPAYDALFVYRKRPKFPFRKIEVDTLGPGLKPEVEEALCSSDQAVRQAAIRTLVEGWLARRMESLRLSPDEQAAWRDEMEKRKQEGQSYLEAYQRAGWKGSVATMKSCPFCEAAAGACRAR
jgi:hypothetical protein